MTRLEDSFGIGDFENNEERVAKFAARVAAFASQRLHACKYMRGPYADLSDEGTMMLINMHQAATAYLQNIKANND